MMRKVAIFLALAGLAACWIAGSVLIAPSPASVGMPPPDLPAENVSWTTDDGRRVNGWYVPGRTTAPGHGAAILLHPLRADRRTMLGRARFLHRAGYAVLMFDFQGHGESPGTSMTFGFLEARDAGAAVRYLRNRLPDERIGVLGVSLGGAAALLGAAAASADALVLEAVYANFVDAVENRLALRFGAQARYLSPLLLWQIGPRLGFDPANLSPIERIGAVRAPLLLIAGSDDRRVTLAQSRALYATAPDPKNLWVIDGARHQNFHKFAKREYERRVLAFFGQHLR